MWKTELIREVSGKCVETTEQAETSRSQFAGAISVDAWYAKTASGPTKSGFGLSGTGVFLAAVATGALKCFALFVPSSFSGHLGRLRAERRAMSEARRGESPLDDIFDATLDRLGNCKSQPSWWRKVVLTAEGDYIVPYAKYDPHFLRLPSVRDWLSDRYVRDDLKALAKETILATGTDTSTQRGRLANAYAHYTGEDSCLAELRINTVTSGLVAAALSTLKPSQRLLLSLTRESNLRNNRNAEILDALSRLERIYVPLLQKSERQERDIMFGTAAGVSADVVKLMD